MIKSHMKHSILRIHSNHLNGDLELGRDNQRTTEMTNNSEGKFYLPIEQ